MKVQAPRVTSVPVRPLQPRLAVDFDGVIHGYSKGWCGGRIYDPPMEGCAEALHELSKRYELVIFTARTNLDDVRRWLVEHRLAHYFKDISNTKPAAVAYLDDRGIRFTSWAQALEDLNAA